MADLLSFATVGRLVLAAGVAVMAYYLGRGTAPGESTPTVSLSHQSNLITGPDDLESTVPIRLVYGDRPDSTHTDQVTLPTWLSKLPTGTDTTGESSDPTSTSSSAVPSARPSEEPEISSPTMESFSTLPYVVVPMTNGRPSLAVTSEAATLQSLSPETGRPIEWTVPVPTERNRASIWGSASTTPGRTVAAAGIGYRRGTDWGELKVQVGYAATGTGRGGIVNVSVSTGYEW